MYLSFSIHSSVNGHLHCFKVLAIVNSAAMNIGVLVSFSILVSSGYMPSSGIAGPYGGFVAVSVYIPTSNAREFPFLHILFIIYSL